MSFEWIQAAAARRLAIAAAGGPLINITIEPEGIAIWHDGDGALRTWAELARATIDPLTPSVEAVAARVKRKCAQQRSERGSA